MSGRRRSVQSQLEYVYSFSGCANVPHRADKENLITPTASSKGTKRKATPAKAKAVPQKKARRGSSKKNKKNTQESVSEVEDLAIFGMQVSEV